MSYHSAQTSNMRLLHTADWQIGMKAAHAGGKAEQVRQARLDAAERVVELANREQVDLILLAGDTFEHPAPEAVYISAVRDILGRAVCPVLLLPGNHDRLEPSSVWLDSRWDEIPNLTVLREPTPVEVNGIQFLPCPIRDRKSDANPTEWIKPNRHEKIQVVIAHGSISGDTIGVDDHPIPINTAERTGADYVALGHWHSTRTYGSRMAYSGTPEQSKFTEDNSGNVLLVQIDEAGVEPRIEVVRTGQLQWMKVGHDTPITSNGDLQNALAFIVALQDPARTLLDLKLSGILFPAELTVLDEIRTQCSHFLHARIDTSGLRAAPAGNDWLVELPPGLIQKAALRLREVSAKSGREGQVATEALLQLFHFSKEALSC